MFKVACIGQHKMCIGPFHFISAPPLLKACFFLGGGGGGYGKCFFLRGLVTLIKLIKAKPGKQTGKRQGYDVSSVRRADLGTKSYQETIIIKVFKAYETNG